jgi:phosphoglycerate kinase
MRIDINLPVVNGRIMEDNPRLEVFGNILALLSEYAGLVVISHQGRKGRDDFIPLKQHTRVLEKILPTDVEIEYVPFEKTFSKETKEKISNLKKGQIILLDNIRFLDEEMSFNPKTSKFIDFFKGLVKCCVNDAMPTWHRATTSLMALPYIAQTWIGLRSIHELKILKDTREETEKNSTGICLGGAKLDKIIKYLPRLCEIAELYTGGLPGQLVARAYGYNLGEKNECFLEKKFGRETFELIKKLIKKYKIRHPIDFVVRENDEDKVFSLEEISHSKGMIMDIGPGTVERYAEELQSKTIVIRGGPMGVYEKGYGNGAELTKRIAGFGLVFLGGDTASEITMYGLDKIIESVGGSICLSGGAFLHGLVGEKYPSVDILIKKLYSF